MLTFGSLFSGIGGIDLGLERAGMTCAWQVEIDAYCQKVLAKHWPHVARYGDIRGTGEHNLAPVDLIAGGFPCQPHSLAGERRASQDERDLWPEFYRVIRELKPQWVLAENVPGVLSSEDGRFLRGVLKDLATSGYDAEWTIISAESVGAPHLRERIFLVAYPQSIGRRSRGTEPAGQCWQSGIASTGVQISHPDSDRCRDRALQHQRWTERETAAIIGNDGPQRAAAHADFQSLEVRTCFGGDAHQELTTFKRDCSTGTGQWAVEPDVVRVVHGVPSRVDRLRGLGNAVVPQVAEFAGRCIVAVTQELHKL